MLLEFHTSPYDNPFHPVPLSYLPGFELEVQVRFTDCRYYVRVLETTDLNLFCALLCVWLGNSRRFVMGNAGKAL